MFLNVIRPYNIQNTQNSKLQLLKMWTMSLLEKSWIIRSTVWDIRLQNRPTPSSLISDTICYTHDCTQISNLNWLKMRLCCFKHYLYTILSRLNNLKIQKKSQIRLTKSIFGHILITIIKMSRIISLQFHYSYWIWNFQLLKIESLKF